MLKHIKSAIGAHNLGMLIVAASFIGSVFGTLAHASEEAVRITQNSLYGESTNDISSGLRQLQEISEQDPDDVEARFGLGVLTFFGAVEKFAQSYYRHGFRPPASLQVTLFRLPIGENPSPETLTYEQLRGYFKVFRDDLAKAEEILATIDGKPVLLPLKINRIAIDGNGDGHIVDSERLMVFISRLIARQRREVEDPFGQWGGAASDFDVTFDTADVYWLRGYAHMLMAITDFYLAHDWRVTFDTAFHLFFPEAGLPMTQALDKTPSGAGLGLREAADAVTFIHTLNWPVVEPQRMAAVRQHLLAVISLSRANWASIRAESDDNNEWIPAAQQTQRFAALEITEERISNWLEILTEAEAILEGKTLLPHWRITRRSGKAINLKRVFEEPRQFDLVLWITGVAAVPYLEDGKDRTSSLRWRRLLRSFGDQFGMFALWIN